MLLFHQGEECICADRIANASERKGLDLQLFKHRATSDISNPSQIPNSSQLIVVLQWNAYIHLRQRLVQ